MSRLLLLIKPTSCCYLINSPLKFGPFNSFIQRRWKKPVDSAQTRLENRTIDLTFNRLTSHLRNLNFVLQISCLMSLRRPGCHLSLNSMSRWSNVVGLNIIVTQFVRKYPHIFEFVQHRGNGPLCCRVTSKMKELIQMEASVTRDLELESVVRVKKLLMMSIKGTLHIYALRLIRRELGLPEDFRDSILAKYTNDFKLIDLETVELVNTDETLGVAHVETWREKEYREKWLSEFETKYAFPINFPTGFKMEKGFRPELKNWQRLQYLKPYEGKKEHVRVRTCGGIDRFEKRAVGILHEFLCMTVEKMVEVERLAHFKKDLLGMKINVRELLLKHQGIFYISTKGNMKLVYLREAYSKGCLTEPNPLYDVRSKMLDLLLLGCRNTTELQASNEDKEAHNVMRNESKGGTGDGDWIIPILNTIQQNK